MKTNGAASRKGSVGESRTTRRPTFHPAMIRSMKTRLFARPSVAPPPAAVAVIAEVADAFGYDLDDLYGFSRLARVCRARQVAMTGLVNAGFPPKDVAAFFSRDQSSVYYANKIISFRTSNRMKYQSTITP